MIGLAFICLTRRNAETILYDASLNINQSQKNDCTRKSIESDSCVGCSLGCSLVLKKSIKVQGGYHSKIVQCALLSFYYIPPS